MRLRSPLTKAFENDADLLFEYQLAEQLCMTVAKLRQELTNDEFLRWGIYYARKSQEAELARKSGK
jgi:hypothetical protein